VTADMIDQDEKDNRLCSAAAELVFFNDGSPVISKAEVIELSAESALLTTYRAVVEGQNVGLNIFSLTKRGMEVFKLAEKAAGSVNIRVMAEVDATEKISMEDRSYRVHVNFRSHIRVF
jgi:hypothetical protein